MLRIARYFGVGLAILVVAAITALGIYTHTDSFRELVREKLLAAINDSVRGRVDVARLEGSIWGNLTLVDVRMSYNGVEIARIPRLGINHSLLPLLWNRVQIFHLVADRPLLRLRDKQDGTWNIVEAFSPAQPAPTKSSNWVVSLNSLEVQNGDISITTHEQKHYRLRDLVLQGDVRVGLTGMTFDVSQLFSRVQLDGIPEARVQGSLIYQNVTGSPASFETRNFTVQSGNSTVTVAGKIKDLKTFDTEARLSIERLMTADAAGFVPQWPVKSKISGVINLRGPASALHGDFSLATADGKIGGRFQAALTGDRPHYQADLTVAGIDLYKLLGRQEAVGIANASLKATGTGFDLTNIAAEGDARIEAASIESWKIGNVHLQGRVAQRIATVSGEIRSDLGHAEWKGQIALEKTPNYRVSLSADQLNIQKLSAQRKAITGILNLNGVVSGSGLALAEMNARTEIQLRPSRIAEVNIDRARLVAAVDGKRIRIREAFVKAGDTTLNASGDMGTDLKQQGRFDYRLQVGTLSPWLDLLGTKGSGSMNVSGRASGTLSDLKTAGTLAANSLRLGATAVRTGSMNYDLNYFNRESKLQGRVNFDLSDVEGGYHLQRLAGVVTLLPKVPYSFEVQARVRDDQSRDHTMTASVVYQPANIVARVTELTLNLPGGAWRLTQPVVLSQRQQDFLVDRLTMQNNDRRLFLDGRFSLSGNQALRLSIDRLPIESLRSFYPVKAQITGLLSAQGQLGGTAAAPQINATVKLENSKIAGQSYAGLFGAVSYSGKMAQFKAMVQQDQQHQLNANGTLPISLGWQNGWHAAASGSLNGRIQSSGLSLAFLNAFSGKAVQGIDGELALDVRLQGTFNRPMAGGFVRLRDGKLTPSALGIKVTRINLDGVVEPRGIRVRQLSARSGAGELNGSGFVGLNNFTAQTIAFSITAERWPAINTQQYRAVMNGSINLNGTVKAPRIDGKLEVLSGEVRPDLAFLDHGSTPTKRDPTITIVSANNGESPPNENSRKSEEAADNPLVRNTGVHIQINIPNNLWVRHRNANVELSGNVQVTQTPGGKPMITGVIETIRGWVGFQGRRFTLTRGKVEFTGGAKINAALDVAAEYRVANYLVNATVNGTMEKPALKLASDPQLDQADILALLLFNKPMSALGKNEQVSLQQDAINITSGFAASTIGAAVSKALGLQNLGVDLADVEFSGGQVRYGRYVSRNTFVSVGEGVTGKTGQEASAEYQITPDWKLDVTTSTKGANGIDIVWHKRY